MSVDTEMTPASFAGQPPKALLSLKRRLIPPVPTGGFAAPLTPPPGVRNRPNNNKSVITYNAATGHTTVTAAASATSAPSASTPTLGPSSAVKTILSPSSSALSSHHVADTSETTTLPPASSSSSSSGLGPGPATHSASDYDTVIQEMQDEMKERDKQQRLTIAHMKTQLRERDSKIQQFEREIETSRSTASDRRELCQVCRDIQYVDEALHESAEVRARLQLQQAQQMAYWADQLKYCDDNRGRLESQRTTLLQHKQKLEAELVSHGMLEADVKDLATLRALDRRVSFVLPPAQPPPPDGSPPPVVGASRQQSAAAESTTSTTAESSGAGAPAAVDQEDGSEREGDSRPASGGEGHHDEHEGDGEGATAEQDGDDSQEPPTKKQRGDHSDKRGEDSDRDDGDEDNDNNNDGNDPGRVRSLLGGLDDDD
jgi:hypothetical protein